MRGLERVRETVASWARATLVEELEAEGRWWQWHEQGEEVRDRSRHEVELGSDGGAESERV